MAQTEAILEEQIRQHAYRLYEERGYEEGHAVEDWLCAERDVRGFASRTGKVEPDHTSTSAASKEECDCP